MPGNVSIGGTLGVTGNITTLGTVYAKDLVVNGSTYVVSNGISTQTQLILNSGASTVPSGAGIEILANGQSGVCYLKTNLDNSAFIAKTVNGIAGTVVLDGSSGAAISNVTTNKVTITGSPSNGTDAVTVNYLNSQLSNKADVSSALTKTNADTYYAQLSDFNSLKATNLATQTYVTNALAPINTSISSIQSTMATKDTTSLTNYYTTTQVDAIKNTINSSINSTQTSLQGSIDTKANSSDVTTLTGRVGTLETQYSSQNNSINTLNSEYSSLLTTVNNNSTSISGFSSSISTINSNISQINNSLSNKVDTTYLTTNYFTSDYVTSLVSSSCANVSSSISDSLKDTVTNKNLTDSLLLKADVTTTTDIYSKLNDKANNSDVTNKATTSYVDTSIQTLNTTIQGLLDVKVDSGSLSNQLAVKANKDYVDEQLALHVLTTDLQTKLNDYVKTDTLTSTINTTIDDLESYINTGLTAKADKTDLTALQNNKTDKSYVDTNIATLNNKITGFVKQSDLDTQFNSYILKTTYNTDIGNINNILNSTVTSNSLSDTLSNYVTKQSFNPADINTNISDINDKLLHILTADERPDLPADYLYDNCGGYSYNTFGGVQHYIQTLENQVQDLTNKLNAVMLFINTKYTDFTYDNTQNYTYPPNP